MSVLLKVYYNEDDALLFWSIRCAHSRFVGLRDRALKDAAGRSPVRSFLVNRIGFDTAGHAPVDTNGAALMKSSTEWPFQTFSWADHDANRGRSVQYRVVPVLRE